MSRYPIFAVFAVGFLLAAAVHAAQSDAAALGSGFQMPTIAGKTLTGKSLELPAAALGKPAVVVFSFSRTAGKDARLWNEHLGKGFPESVTVYDVMELQAVPRLFRGMALAGIRGTMPISMQEHSIVLYEDEKLWKVRLAVSDDSRAYIVLLGAEGHIRWRNSERYSDSEYTKLQNEIELLFQQRP